VPTSFTTQELDFDPTRLVSKSLFSTELPF